MAISPERIQAIANYYNAKNAARTSALYASNPYAAPATTAPPVRGAYPSSAAPYGYVSDEFGRPVPVGGDTSQAEAPPSLSGQAADAFAGLGEPGNRAAHVPSLASQIPQEEFDKLSVEQKLLATLQPDDSKETFSFLEQYDPGRAPSDVIPDVLDERGIPDWLQFIVMQNPGAKVATGITDQILAPRDEADGPSNAAQWVLDLLSIGNYAVGEAGKEAVENAQESGGDPFQTIGGAIEGIGRGAAEGVGVRFDGERPYTPGQGAEDLGITGAVGDFAADTVRNFGGDPGSQETWRGIAGGATRFSADMIADPFTYLGGTGIVRGLSKAAQAAGDAVRAEAGLARQALDAAGAFGREIDIRPIGIRQYNQLHNCGSSTAANTRAKRLTRTSSSVARGMLLHKTFCQSRSISC